MDLVDSRGYQLVPDARQFNQGIGGIIQQLMANRLQQKALGGDQSAQAQLSVASPNQANAVGGILGGNARQEQMQMQQEQVKQQQEQDILGKIATGYNTAKDKRGFLAAAQSQLQSAGMTDLAMQMQEDLDMYVTNPAQVDVEYNAAYQMYGSPQADSTPAGVREFEYLLQQSKSDDPDVANAASIKLRTQAAPSGAAQQVIMIGGVPHKFNPQDGVMEPIEVSGSEVTSDTVADNKSKIAGSVKDAELSSELKNKPDIIRAVKKAEMEASARGEALTDYNRAKVAMPGLIATVNSLKELAPLASSTYAEKFFDQGSRQLGFGATKGATARAKFTAIVDNQVLPLLRQTFGAAFTAKEGETLKATMGDPNASPGEKMAQLDAFISRKVTELDEKEQLLKNQNEAPAAKKTYDVEYDPATGSFK